MPSKSVNARRAAYHNRKLNVVDHNQFVIRSLKSVNTKTPQAKHSVNLTYDGVGKQPENQNVNTTKTLKRPTVRVVGSVKPHLLELTPSVSSSSKVTMISRFTDCKLSDRKAGSKGISGQLGRNVADSIAERLKRPTAYKFRQIAYVTNVRLARNIRDDPYDELFDYLQQYEKLVIASRAKKLEKTHDPLALVAHTRDIFQNDPEDTFTSEMMLLARVITQRYSTPTNNHLRSSSNTRNQAVVQADIVNIQRGNVRNDGRIARRSYNIQEESAEGSNVQKETGNVQRTLRTISAGNITNVHCYNCSEKKDEAGVILSNEKNDFLIADAAQMEEIEELSANMCMMARIQPANIDSDEGPSYDSAFISEVQTPSTSYMNPLFSINNHEQTYHEQPKIINSTTCDDQINSDIIFDDPNVEVNDGRVEHDKNAHDSYDNELE
ncbi:hypothetical protein Tco_1252717 [Tanacetum coccineum]